MDKSKFFERAVPKLAPLFTKELKHIASTRGWPQTLVDEISITIKNKSMSLNPGKADLGQINRLEYGDLTHPANPAVREFSYEANNIMIKNLESLLFKELKARGVL